MLVQKLWPNCEDTDQNPNVTSDGQNVVLDLVEAVPTNPFTDVSREEQTGLKSTTVCQSKWRTGYTIQDVESDEEEGSVADIAKISWKQVSDALNTFIKFVESNKSHNFAELINLCIVRDDFLKKS